VSLKKPACFLHIDSQPGTTIVDQPFFNSFMNLSFFRPSAIALCLLTLAIFNPLPIGAAASNSTYSAATPTGVDVQLGLSREYDSGVQTSNALLFSGLVLEFHKSASNAGIFYRVGKLQGMSVTWGNSQHSGGDGYWPAVALSKEGYVIVVRSNKDTKSGSEQYYRVGKIDPQGDQNQSIAWKTDFIHWDGGFHTSIAMNDNGVIVGVHEGNSSGNRLYYRVGHLRNPDGGDYTINWGSGLGAIGYDDGINPHIAINNQNQVVEVHQVPGEPYLHYRRGTLSGGKITFADSVRYDNNGEQPAVVLLDSGLVLEVHCKGGLISRAGRLSHSNSTEIEWSTPEKADDALSIKHPALATNGRYVIQTHENLIKLHFSTSAIRDRGNWMGDNLSWLANKSLDEIVIPGSHDAGMYRGEGLGALALTQDQPIYDQLRGGVRYFDLRVLAGSPQRIYHGSALAKGPPLQEVLDDVKRFMAEGRKEAVVLKFSHFMNFANCSPTGLSPDYAKLATSLSNTLGPWLYDSKTGASHPARVPLNELLNTGGKVIVVVDGDWATSNCNQALPYTFVFRDWDAAGPEYGQFNVYDKYANTTDYDSMRADQFEKFLNYNGEMLNDPNIDCDLFLLSWTLTPVTDVSRYSKTPNRNLAEEMNHVSRNRYGLIPNILYVDYYQRARVTDTAISMTERLVP
jgi:hypothetical protein